MSSDDQARWENRATKLTMTGLFLGLLAVFSTRILRRGKDFELRPFDLLLLGLATFRTGRLIAYERVAEPLRAPFTATKTDESGTGATVVAEGKGVRRALGELLSCPICVGTWASAGFVYGLHFAPRFTRVYLAIMGATGVAELLSGLSEALTWLGRAARKASSA